MNRRPVILVIDDVPNNVELISASLGDLYDIQCAFGGREALELVAEQPPDLILLDIMMPGLDGYGVLSKLKTNPATRRLPVIFVTARNDVGSESEALAAGAVDFIHKPINPSVIRARVATHLQLAVRERQVRQLNDTLETQVHQRTIELAQALDAAQAACRAKSTFLGNMGHELRTPIHQIIASMHVVSRRNSDPGITPLIDRVSKVTRNFGGVIERILDLSKLEAEEMRLSPGEFSPAQLLARLTEQVGETAAAKGIRLVVDVDPLLPCQLMGDALRLEEALECLLDNALKFSGGGEVTLRVRQLEARPDYCSVQFEIEDQGIGIDKDDQAKLFQLFFQLDGSMTRQHGGTGLGLVLSQRLIRLMGGKIGVDSDAGCGSRFWVRLQLARTASGEGPVNAELQLRRLQRLLADGDLLARRLWRVYAPQLQAVLGERFAAIAAAMDEFDLEMAAALLDLNPPG